MDARITRIAEPIAVYLMIISIGLILTNVFLDDAPDMSQDSLIVMGYADLVNSCNGINSLEAYSLYASEKNIFLNKFGTFENTTSGFRISLTDPEMQLNSKVLIDELSQCIALKQSQIEGNYKGMISGLNKLLNQCGTITDQESWDKFSVNYFAFFENYGISEKDSGYLELDISDGAIEQLTQEMNKCIDLKKHRLALYR